MGDTRTVEERLLFTMKQLAVQAIAEAQASSTPHSAVDFIIRNCHRIALYEIRTAVAEAEKDTASPTTVKIGPEHPFVPRVIADWGQPLPEWLQLRVLRAYISHDGLIVHVDAKPILDAAMERSDGGTR